MDKSNPNNVKVTGPDLVTGMKDHRDLVYDAAMAMHRLVLAGRINRQVLAAGDREASAALDAMDEAFNRAEEVERGSDR